jgi:hypothetical protein
MYMYVTFLSWTPFNVQLIGVSEPGGLYATILDVYNRYIALTFWKTVPSNPNPNPEIKLLNEYVDGYLFSRCGCAIDTTGSSLLSE